MGTNNYQNEARWLRQHRPNDQGGWSPQLPNDEYLRKESLKYIALNWWLSQHLIEMTSGRIPLKIVYLAYTQWCSLRDNPEVTIHAFNRAISEVQLIEWPSVRKKQTALGIIYINLTLRAWVTSLPTRHIIFPSEGGSEEPDDPAGTHPVVLRGTENKPNARVLSTIIV